MSKRSARFIREAAAVAIAVVASVTLLAVPLTLALMVREVPNLPGLLLIAAWTPSIVWLLVTGGFSKMAGALAYRVPPRYMETVRKLRYERRLESLMLSPKASVFAHEMVDADWRDLEKNDRGNPRETVQGEVYWGFFHDDGRVDYDDENPFYRAREAARVLDTRQEAWSNMPRLLRIAAQVRDFIPRRAPEHAALVTELTLAWFDAGVSDDDARAVLGDHPAEVAKLVLQGIPVEYATELAGQR